MAAIIFVFVGIAFIFSNGMQTSPVFMVYGYKTYKCDDGYIITRLSREKINILMEDGQIYAEKFTSACLICKVFYGKMKAQ